MPQDAFTILKSLYIYYERILSAHRKIYRFINIIIHQFIEMIKNTLLINLCI